METATFIGHMRYIDRDGEEVELEIWHDPVANAPFAVDVAFLEHGDCVVQSPYNAGVELVCPDDQALNVLVSGGYVYAQGELVTSAPRPMED